MDGLTGDAEVLIKFTVTRQTSIGKTNIENTNIDC